MCVYTAKNLSTGCRKRKSKPKQEGKTEMKEKQKEQFHRNGVKGAPYELKHRDAIKKNCRHLLKNTPGDRSW